MIVLLFSLTVHEMSHAWTADQFGDPTARLLGRVSLNPVVHADPIGTISFRSSRWSAARRSSGGPSRCLSTWRYLRHPRRDYMLVAAAGPASNLVLAFVRRAAARPAAGVAADGRRADGVGAGRGASSARPSAQRAARGLQHDSDPAARRRQRAGRTAPANLAETFNRIRPYGFILLYALILTNGFSYIVVPPYLFIMSWLPTQ